jgi:CHAT domain-containing protein
MQAELVTLSACQTGQGELYAGEGLIGLGRGLLYSGAQNLLVSLWKVTDATTPIFMQNFYKSILQKSPIAQALQKAKRAMIINY